MLAGRHYQLTSILVILLLAPVMASFDLRGEFLDSRLDEVSWDSPVTGSEIGVFGSSQVILMQEGISRGHPDLGCADFNEYPLYPRGESRHGQMVAGVLCGDGGAYDGKYRGVAPGARVVTNLLWYPQGDSFFPFSDPEIRGKVHVGTHSLVNDPVPAWEHAGFDPIADDLILFQSAGNSGSSGEPHPWVSEYAFMHSVTAYDALRGEIFDFSTPGDPEDESTWPLLAAPICGRVPSSLDEEELLLLTIFSNPCGPDFQFDTMYQDFGGTSAAAPFAAGVAALVREVAPALNATEVAGILAATTDLIGEPIDANGDGVVTRADYYLEYGPLSGHGLINATRAILTAYATNSYPQVPHADLAVCVEFQIRGSTQVIGVDPECLAPRDQNRTAVASGSTANSTATSGTTSLESESTGSMQLDSDTKDASAVSVALVSIVLASALAKRKHRN